MEYHRPRSEQNMRVLMAGAGVSGVGVARMLAALDHVELSFVDDQRAGEEISIPGGCYGAGKQAGKYNCYASEDINYADFDMIVTSPGWRPDNPFLFKACTQSDIEVMGDVELAWRLDQQGIFGDPHIWVGVTGTNGKTTTTAMLTEMFQADGYKAAAVGNIGYAIGEALISPERIDVLCVEFSSFQLHWSKSIDAAAGCVLNLAEDHIDWHGSFDNYADDKIKLLHSRIPIINADDPAVLQACERNAIKDTVSFTMNEPQPGQIGIKNGFFYDRAFSRGQEICSVDILNIIGSAVRYDALAAMSIALSQGVRPDAIKKALSSFELAPHRGQIIHRSEGAIFVDNSKATNPHAVLSALDGIDNILWFAGGQLKGAHIDEVIAAHGPHMTAAFILGVDRDIFVESLSRQFPFLPIHVSDSTDPHDAMQELCEAARPYIDHAREEGSTVYACLAPASASLDMYSGMGQRGDIFTHFMRALYT